MKPEELELLVNRIVAMGKVLYGLHVVSLAKQRSTPTWYFYI
jgi:hypothetical protein